MRRLRRLLLDGLAVLLLAVVSGTVLLWVLNCFHPRPRLILSHPSWAAFIASDAKTLRLWTQELRPIPPPSLVVPIDKPYASGAPAAAGAWGFQNYSWSPATVARADRFGFALDVGSLSARIGTHYYVFVVVKHQLFLPWWPILFIAIAVGVFPAKRFLFSRRKEIGHCHHCGYDLTGNVSGVCPECGTTVAVPRA